VDDNLVMHYLLGFLEFMLCIIPGTCIYKIRNKILGLSKNTNAPTYYHATGHATIITIKETNLINGRY
jgi:hypothetical protein